MRRLAIAVFGALAFSAAPAHAVEFNVNTVADSPTAQCTEGGPCSLRGALSRAINNGSVGEDVINVPAGVYPVAELGLSGVAASQIVISGAGAGSTVIEAAGTNRVFVLSSQAGVTLRGLTVQGGETSGTEAGGNIRVNSARLTLDRVRVTDGQATAGGGGIGAQSLTSIAVVDITRSLIDTNEVTGSGTGGGGIALQAGTAGSVTATISDSTIAYNTSFGAGAGIASSLAPSLRGVTIAYNTAGGGTGGLQAASGTGPIQGSIIAGNRGSNNAFDNCALPVNVTDQGGNVDSINDCGFTNPASRINTNPQLATIFDGSQPPVLTLPETSPAVDLAECGTSTVDQRGVQRPQGVRCDAGAYELNVAPDTAVAGAGPPFTFSSNEAGTTFECSVDGAPFTPCVTPFDPAAAPGTHTLAVRAVDPQGLPDPTPATVTFTVQPPPVTPTPTPSPTPTPTATPVVNRTIVVGPARGTVKVKVPGSRRYVELDSTVGIPVGSRVDTRKGRVTLTSIPKAGAAPQTAVFFDGLFRVTQSRGITNLTLTEQLAACPKKKSSRASAAAKKAKKRRLWGDGKGAFRTSGKYSAATVRGTKWLVEDSCAGTRTRVRQGSVSVRHRKRTIILRAGKSYLAKPR